MKTRFLAFLAFFLVASTGATFAASPFRLFEVAATRYVRDAKGTLVFEHGFYSAAGEFRLYGVRSELPAGTTVPDEAMNRLLLPLVFFSAYEGLGAEALANFDLSQSVTVNGATNFVLAVAANARVNVGTVANLSTRGTVVAGGEPLIGGFVVEDRPRRVLLRAIGPTLSSFQVNAPLGNPVLTLFRQGTQVSVAANDDWGQQANAADIETASASAGAFALSRNSKDAVLLLELPPGLYTAHLGSADATGGSALLEIYLLP